MPSKKVTDIGFVTTQLFPNELEVPLGFPGYHMIVQLIAALDNIWSQQLFLGYDETNVRRNTCETNS